MSGGPTSVYRYYDAHGVLLYVGITERGIRRNREHNATKDWWRHVARQEVDHFATRSEALAHEKALIIRHAPPFNTQHNPDAAALRQAYEMFVASVADRLDPQKLMSDLRGKLRLHLIQQASPAEATFRTDLADAALVPLIVFPGQVQNPHVQYMGNAVGTLALVETQLKVVATFTVRLKEKHLERLGRVRRAIACLRWMHGKPPRVFVHHVELHSYGMNERYAREWDEIGTLGPKSRKTKAAPKPAWPELDEEWTETLF